MAKELYVGHLSVNTTEEDVRNLFSVMGMVTSVHLIIDPQSGEFKRCGYVRMAATVDPNEVVETLDGAYLIDQEIHVSIARPQKPGMSGTAAKNKPWLKPGPKPKAKQDAAPASARPARTMSRNKPATPSTEIRSQRNRQERPSRPGSRPSGRRTP